MKQHLSLLPCWCCCVPCSTTDNTRAPHTQNTTKNCISWAGGETGETSCYNSNTECERAWQTFFWIIFFLCELSPTPFRFFACFWPTLNWLRSAHRFMLRNILYWMTLGMWDNENNLNLLKNVSSSCSVLVLFAILLVLMTLVIGKKRRVEAI